MHPAMDTGIKKGVTQNLWTTFFYTSSDWNEQDNHCHIFLGQ